MKRRYFLRCGTLGITAKEPKSKQIPRNKQKLLLPNTNELATCIMGKKRPLLPPLRVPHKAGTFKALSPS